MPFGGLLSLAGGAVGIGSSLAGLIGGTPASHVPSYSYASMPSADAGAMGGTANLGNYNIGANYLPQYQSVVNAMQPGNPYANSYLAGSTGAGSAMYGAGAGITGTSLGQLGNVQQLMNMGFDPQNALYNYTQNLNQQQNLAALSQSGVASTPYGQGVNAMANNQFNMNWENNQLGRASQAAGAAGGLLGSIGQGATTGTNLMAGGASLPYSAYSTINNNALSALTGAANFGNTTAQLPQQQINDYLSYLSGGTGQQNANTNLANSQFQQSQMLGQGLGAGLSNLGNAWGKVFSGGGSGGVGNYGQVANATGLGAGTGGIPFPMF